MTPEEREEMLRAVHWDSNSELHARVLRLLVRVNRVRCGHDAVAIADAEDRYQIAVQEVRERRWRRWGHGDSP